MADDDKADRPNMEWHVRLNGVERLDREEDDPGDVYFDVEFELSGPGVTGMLSAMVVDPASDETVIAEGVEQLLVALEEFGAALRLRTGAGLAEPHEG